MLNIICKTSHQVCSSARTSPFQNFYFLQQIQTFSSSLKSIRKIPNQQSFSVTYLINSRGFSPEQTLLTSKVVKFEAADKPNSVMEFLENHKFNKTQISNIVRKHPWILVCDPQKTLFPKFEFLKSKGLSSTDIARIVYASTNVFKRSLGNSIIPAFNSLSNLLQSEKNAIAAIKRCTTLLLFREHGIVTPKVEILREAGVQNGKIVFLLTKQPRVFMTSNSTFRQNVEDVVKMGFSPSSMNFVLAVQAFRAMNKSTWEKKVNVYKKWGWTENEILIAFKKHPLCMMASEDKINRVMDFSINKLGWESLSIATRPRLITMSLENRIIPRNAVYQALLLKGLIKINDTGLMTLLLLSETRFLEKVLSYREEEGPELLKLYKENLDLAK